MAEQKSDVKFSWFDAITLTAGYIVTYTLAMGFIKPTQTILLSEVAPQIGLLFLPHGIRVLGFHYFGWKAIIYLLPGSYLMWTLAVFGNNVPLHPLAPIASISATYLGVIVANLLFELGYKISKPTEWKFLLFAGFVSSIANAASLSFLQHPNEILYSMIGYATGDMAGMALCLIAIMYFFRFLRHYKKHSD